MTNLELIRKRLLYQSQHRGTKEMDLVLGEFARQNLDAMSLEELKKFEFLLSQPDQEIQNRVYQGDSILDILFRI